MSIVIHGSSKQCRRKQCYPKPRGFHSRFPRDDKILKKKKFLSSPASKIQRGKKTIGQFLLAFTLGGYQKRKKTKQGSLSAKRRRAGSIESIIICAATPKSVLITAARIDISGCRFCDLIDEGRNAPGGRDAGRRLPSSSQPQVRLTRYLDHSPSEGSSSIAQGEIRDIPAANGLF
ncbi:hypothetical protein QQF64_017536 [Cirrhinus molitorella]|uniref:Ribosomal protein S14 n=1 Tax=Cirrhinus molitorella TaxID=172907 RepID=A0ABR3LMZ0_9TELE